MNKNTLGCLMVTFATLSLQAAAPAVLPYITLFNNTNSEALFSQPGGMLAVMETVPAHESRTVYVEENPAAEVGLPVLSTITFHVNNHPVELNYQAPLTESKNFTLTEVGGAGGQTTFEIREAGQEGEYEKAGFAGGLKTYRRSSMY